MGRKKVSFEMNEKAYDQLNELCDSLGMSPEDAFEIFAYKTINEQEIPFVITKDELPRDPYFQNLKNIIKISAAALAVIGIVSYLIGRRHH